MWMGGMMKHLTNLAIAAGVFILQSFMQMQSLLIVLSYLE
jgi:hypothetical protein